MIKTLADFFTRVVQRWLPNAFLFAILLTLVVLIAGMISEGQSVTAMVGFWGDGVWGLLTFSMQMVLILVTGHVFSSSPPIQALLRRLAGLARSPGQAIILVTVFAMLAFWINWGFGLIGSALVAREMARRVRGVHYPLLVASAYSSIIIWHAGLSGSIPLKLAAGGSDALGKMLEGRVIPVSETLFDWPNLVICALLLITLPVVNRLMMPPPEQVPPVPDSLFEDETPPAPPSRDQMTPAQRLEHSRVFSFALGGLGAWYLADHFIQGGGIDLNTISLLFLTLGVLFHQTPANYLRDFHEAVRGTSGIVLQFPLYAGIMGMMASSGLAVSISQGFVALSTPQTFPLWTFLSAGLVNFFVPSGGGQWAVQAPIVIPAADNLGVPLNRAAMAVAFGDAWTNLIQPFWTLPMLAIAGLSIKDIMGYCTVALLWTGLVIMAGMALMY